MVSVDMEIIYLKIYSGWVEQRETHRINDWLRWVSAIASTHPTAVSSVFYGLIQFRE